MGLPTIDKTVQAAIAIWRPDLVKDREAIGNDAWHVTFDPRRDIGGAWDGTSSLDAIGDTADFTAFADLVSQVADAGKPRPKPPSRVPVKRRGTQPTTLYCHVTAADLAARLDGDDQGIPLGRVERLGPATLDLLQGWVGHQTVRIQPVIDLTSTDTVDCHDPPAWMREAVILRDQHCVFPWCATDARVCDLDHIEAYLPNGPPGQTSIAKLACLCRRHHNAKTHPGWRYRRLPNGVYHWTSPSGYDYLVDTAEGTVRLP